MAVDQFRDISFGTGETLTDDKLNTLTSNTRYLYERSPRMYFNAYGVKKSSGVKIAAGIITIPSEKATTVHGTASFGSFFTTSCVPVVTVTVGSPYNGRAIASVFGISGHDTVPDNRGFICRIAMAEFQNASINYVVKTMYIHYIAIGY